MKEMIWKKVSLEAVPRNSKHWSRLDIYSTQHLVKHPRLSDHYRLFITYLHQ